MAEIRPMSQGRLKRLMPTLLESGVYPDASRAKAMWQAEPWRFGLSAAGEVALSRRHSHLPLLLIERIWCEEDRLPALVEGLGKIGRELGCERLLSPFLSSDEALPYELAGLSTDRVITPLRLDGLRAPDERPPRVTAGRFDRPDEALALDAAVFEPFWRFDMEWMERSAPGGRLAELRDGRTLIGYAVSRARGSDGHIVRLAVHPDRRRRGAGSTLLRDALEYLAEAGATSVTVNTQIDNAAAIGLYEAFGFVASPQRLRVLISDTL